MFAKYQGVFRSRWKALWWAAGVCLTAYCTVPSKDEDPAASLVPGFMAPHHAKEEHKAVDPWAIDKKTPS